MATVLVALALQACAPVDLPASPPAYETFTSESMATTVGVTLPGGPEAQAHAQAVFRVFERVDERMSEWKDTSPLSAVNRQAGGQPVPVPEDLRRVLQRGVEIGGMTGGAFDVTWAALWGLWDFKSPEPRVPDGQEMARRAELVDFRHLEIDDHAGTVRLAREGMKVGLGGIAKGYALDEAARMLRERGVDSFLLSGGGQLMAGGLKADRPWRVGIRDPRGPRNDYFAHLELRDVSLSTSGDYESYFIQDGVRYHHILDPRTGWPARGLRSATVISPDATLADALSTACLVMGREDSMKLAAKLDQVELILVDSKGQVWTTPGLDGILTQDHAPRGAEEG